MQFITCTIVNTSDKDKYELLFLLTKLIEKQNIYHRSLCSRNLGVIFKYMGIITTANQLMTINLELWF